MRTPFSLVSGKINLIVAGGMLASAAWQIARGDAWWIPTLVIVGAVFLAVQGWVADW